MLVNPIAVNNYAGPSLKAHFFHYMDVVVLLIALNTQSPEP